MLKNVGEKNFKLFRQLKVKFDKKVFFYHENMSLFFLDENLKNSEQLNEQKTKIENNLETFIVHLENMLETIYSKFVNLFEKIENQKSNTNFLSNDLSTLKYELKSKAFSNLLKLDEEFIVEINKTTFFNSTLEKTNIPTVTYKNVNNLEDFVAKYIYIYSEKFDFDKVLNKGLKWYYVNSPAFREESPRWEDERAGYESDYGFVESGIGRMSEMNKEKLFEFKNVENWTSDEIKNQLGLSRTVRSSKNYRWYDGGRMTFNYSFGDYEKVKYYSDINSFYNVKTEFYNVPNVSMEEFDYKNIKDKTRDTVYSLVEPYVTKNSEIKVLIEACEYSSYIFKNLIENLFKDEKIINETEYQTYLNELNNVMLQVLSTFRVVNMLHHNNSESIVNFDEGNESTGNLYSGVNTTRGAYYVINNIEKEANYYFYQNNSPIRFKFSFEREEDSPSKNFILPHIKNLVINDGNLWRNRNDTYNIDLKNYLHGEFSSDLIFFEKISTETEYNAHVNRSWDLYNAFVKNTYTIKSELLNESKTFFDYTNIMGDNWHAFKDEDYQFIWFARDWYNNLTAEIPYRYYQIKKYDWNKEFSQNEENELKSNNYKLPSTWN